MVIDDQADEIYRKAVIDIDGQGKRFAERVTIVGPASVFGDFAVSTDTPVAQIDALKGITEDHETFTSTGGSVAWKTDHGGKEFQCRTGTNVGGYGIIRTRRAIRYRPGQGMKLRFTARFAPPVALLAQRAGGIGVGSELSFGYDGDNGFGVLLRTGGRLEIRTLTISAAASGAEIVTITLDDTAYNVSVTAGTTIFNAYEISTDAQFGPGQTWDAYQNDSTVIFIKQAVGTATGSYSIASTGTLAGSIAQKGAGRAVSDTWVYKADWDNQDVFGEQSSEDNGALDPTKGNVYQIEYGYLGYSGIRYSIMNPLTNSFEVVHTIKYPNSAEVPSLDIPNFKMGWFAASLGSTTDSSVYGASAASFVSGVVRTFRNPIAHSNSRTGIGTTLTNLISIRVRPEFGGFVNLSDVLIDAISIGVEATKPVICELHYNPTLTGTTNWTYHDENNSIVEYDTSNVTVAAGTEIFPISLGKSDGRVVNLSDYDIRLERGDILTLAVKASSGTVDAVGAISWTED